VCVLLRLCVSATYSVCVFICVPVLWLYVPVRCIHVLVCRLLPFRMHMCVPVCVLLCVVIISMNVCILTLSPRFCCPCVADMGSMVAAYFLSTMHLFCLLLFYFSCSCYLFLFFFTLYVCLFMCLFHVCMYLLCVLHVSVCMCVYVLYSLYIVLCCTCVADMRSMVAVPFIPRNIHSRPVFIHSYGFLLSVCCVSVWLSCLSICLCLCVFLYVGM